ncbi:putative hydrolase of alpha/beta superfamily [Caulobacter sp. AP07]|uniref:alpha/beta hydrolase n=1 Tax=Caulobacter sp. AP07 TaxID=1144304 RepID=UPI00027220B1|nr:alpha/beta hydrolase-fold protein [Caulobacter sp. AP07]EJL26988.1 putative hydrolase of alpha/beta superfamily [Caulobacter sp. AP07]
MRIPMPWPIFVAAIALSACGDPRTVEGPAGAVATSGPAANGGFVIENSAVIPLHSKAVGRDYEIYVKTPPGYGKPENAGRRYPVIYLTDGPYTFQVASGLSRLPFSQDRFHEFIIVGLSWAHGDVPAASRRRDLTPWRDPEIGGVTGGGEAYFTFLKQEAMPLVEARYRVDPANRTLVGQSYGALFGLWVAFREPRLFANYILTSPSIWFDKGEIMKAEAAYAASHKDLPARIYLATGSHEHPGPGGCAGCDNDMVADQARLAATLKSRNYPGLEIKTHVVEDGFHETTFPVGLMRGLQWLYLKG